MMSVSLDRYLIMNEAAFDAYKNQLFANEQEAIDAAVAWKENSDQRIVIFQQLIIVEEPNVKVRRK